MQYGDQGHEVRALQRALIAKGYDLPRFGVDSDFGQETLMALQRFAKDRGIAWDPDDPVPAALLVALELEDERVEVIAPTSDAVDLEGVKLYDLRREQSDPHPKSKRDRSGKTVRRTPAAIDSIVLHQTGVRFSASSTERLAARALGVACHAMAFRDGFLVWPVEPLWYIHHADRLNARSLGLEVEGVYPGQISSKTRPVGETPLTDEVVHAARMGIKLLVEEGRRCGCPIKYIFAHRQCDSWRRADPGEGLWRRVVVEYAVPELKLVAQQADRFPHPKGATRKGKSIPTRWDPKGVGKY
jgi:N-acetyl-anhydromuramyl-L-alanine amidase AmpD